MAYEDAIELQYFVTYAHMSGHGSMLKQFQYEQDNGIVFCTSAQCSRENTRGHCVHCGHVTDFRKPRVGNGPQVLPAFFTHEGGELAVPWSTALSIVGSLDVTDGGGKAYCLRERKEARRLLKSSKMHKGARSVTRSIIEGLLVGNIKGAKDGTKYAMDNPRKPINAK